MQLDRLPESLHTLYAELLDQAIRAEAEIPLGMPVQGSFVAKTIKGRRYWYLQRLEGERKRQHYLGPDSDTLARWMKDVAERRQETAPDRVRRAQIVQMLIAGGARRESGAVTRVLEMLADSGLFRLGGVVVGTQAFSCYANQLGVRLDTVNARTQDIDIGQERSLAVALDPEHVRIDALEALRKAEPSFFAVPGLDPRNPSTSFKVRGRDLRVDFLTPGAARDADRPVFLPMFGVAATPLPMLGYLIESPTHAVVLGGNGPLINVPRPARFALHELVISGKRPVSEQAKARKDRRQALQILAVLLEDRPEDVVEAWDALEKKPRERTNLRAALASARGDEAADRTRALLGIR